jgi:lipopolysaccharide transport system ATP-binding protein
LDGGAPLLVPGGIALSGVSKHYQLYARPLDRLIELLRPDGAPRHTTVRALDEVTLSIRRGERVGILGQNGSGKSTLLKIISQVLTPSAGEVRVAGRVSALLELGIGFSGELSGSENILQYGILQGMSRDEIAARHDEIVGFAELGEFIDQPIRTYSSGMGLRLAFSCAVFTEPDVLIIDEALSVGDSYFQAKCLHKIRAMLSHDLTFLYVSHSPDSVRTLCERGLLLEHGRMVLDGDSESVAREYERRAFVRSSRYQKGNENRADPSAPVEAAPDATPGERAFATRVAGLRSGSGRIRLTAIDVAAIPGGDSEMIGHGAEFAIRIGYRVHEQPAADTGISASICDRLGNQIAHFNSLDKGIDLAGEAPGALGQVVFRLRNALCPNDFSVIAGVAAMQRHPTTPQFWVTDDLYDYCIGGCTFSVPASSAPASLWGVVALPYDAERSRVVPIALPGLRPFSMAVHLAPDAFVSREIAERRVWEAFETRVIRALLGTVDRFVDLGANIGWYSVVAGLELDGRGRVLAFEPDPENCALLRRNLAENGLSEVTVEEAALADVVGERLLFRSAANLGDHRLYDDPAEARGALPVAVTTFDAAVSPQLHGPAVVKMDTQGSEAMILAGMRGHLAAQPGSLAMLLEFWPHGLDKAGSSAAALVDALRPLGFRIWTVEEEAATLRPTTLDVLAARALGDLAPHTKAFANLLLIPPGHPAEAALGSLPVAPA